ncbi:Ig-like domain-containing protein [Allomuricauda sp. NBRC 101325]|uniref:Ig-like domain-containing protein n=1 Tax=Allomuricauda sp. NBRC 101325 TaxID=1113758 RepID=UPI0024A4CBF5|nr:Ig-like domain-containing protein [Muricauda sp. NBRC 101325]GLU45549.1 hypothetical protein Musp01_31730 [Muricauda sp. NBRC 101325]
MKYSKFPALLVACITILYACSSDSEDPTPEPVPDTIAPEVEFTIPGNTTGGSSSTETPVISNQLVVNVDAKDAGGIAKVEAFINDQKVGEDTAAPYQITIDVSSYASKNASTGKFTDYTLKITVTDTSGNETSQEQIIHIDNELPTISEVTLTEGQVIAGDTNAITFLVNDNEGINAVSAYLNDSLLEEFTGEMYELNINTLSLTDGENNLRIEAIDLANNIATYNVAFIADNTGPVIDLNSIEANQVLDESILLSTSLTDEYSTVTNIQILLTDIEILTDAVEFTAGTEGTVEMNFDPNQFATGEQTFIITATDALLNSTTLEVPISILRKLLTINVPENFNNPDAARLFVFASTMDGELIAIERIYNETTTVTLHTSEETSGDFEYMLTFAEYISGSVGNSTELTTMQNIKPSVLPVLNLSTFYRYKPYWQTNQYQAAGFDPDDAENLRMEGLDYNGGFSSEGSTPKSGVFLQQRENVNSALRPNSIYLSLENLTLNQHSFAVLDWNVPSDLIITPELFTTEGIERRLYQPVMNGEAFESTTMHIYGYFTQDDFNNNIYHKTYGYGYGYLPTEGIPYFLNTTFSNHLYNIRINDYFTERTGEPDATFTPVDWSIDYSFANNQFELLQTGVGHSIGKVFIDSESPEIINGLNITYRWSLLFDSQSMTQVKLPQIPEELQTWGFYSIYTDSNLQVQQVEIKGYEGISDYDTYLNEIIQDHKFPYTISPKMESKFKSSGQGYYYNTPNFLFD